MTDYKKIHESFLNSAWYYHIVWNAWLIKQAHRN